MALLIASMNLAGAFSGLVAAAVVNMDGVGGKPGKRQLSTP
jgi:hypothetical protein